MASVIKNPPLLNDLESYERWREDLLMWKEVTDLSSNKQALAVHLTLKGQAREVANQVSTDDKKKDNGLEILIKKLDEAFLKEPERRKFMIYQDFEECVRRDGLPICDFMREFDMKYFKMKEKGMVLPDEVLAFRLIKNCRLTNVQKDQVMASTKPLSFNEVRATLKRMFEASTGTNSDVNQMQIKVEPVYLLNKDQDDLKSRKTTLERELKEVTSRLEEIPDRGTEGDVQEDVMWTANYTNRRGYRRSGNNRYNRYGRYSRRSWRRSGYDNGCFECGAKDHWVRNCNKVKEDNKEL